MNNKQKVLTITCLVAFGFLGIQYLTADHSISGRRGGEGPNSQDLNKFIVCSIVLVAAYAGLFGLFKQKKQ